MKLLSWAVIIFCALIPTLKAERISKEEQVIDELKLNYNGPIAPQDYSNLSCPRPSAGSFSMLPPPSPLAIDDLRYEQFEVGSVCDCNYTSPPSRIVNSESFSYIASGSCWKVTDDVQREISSKQKYCQTAFLNKYPRGRQVGSCTIRNASISLMSRVCNVNQIGLPLTTTFFPSPAPPTLTQFPQASGNQAYLSIGCSCDYIEKVNVPFLFPYPINPLRPLRIPLWVDVAKKKQLNVGIPVCQQPPNTTKDLYDFALPYCQAECKIATNSIPNLVRLTRVQNTATNVSYSGNACYSKITAEVKVFGPGRVYSNPAGINCPSINCSVEACVMGSRVFLPSLTAVPNPGSALILAQSGLWNIGSRTQSRTPIIYSPLDPNGLTDLTTDFVFDSQTVTFELNGEPGAKLLNGYYAVIQKPLYQMSASHILDLPDLAAHYGVLKVEIDHAIGFGSQLSAPEPFTCSIEIAGALKDSWNCTFSLQNLVWNRTYTFSVSTTAQTGPKVTIILDGDGTGRVDAATGPICQKNGAEKVTCKMSPDEFYISPSEDSYLAQKEALGPFVEWEFEHFWAGSQRFTVRQARDGDTIYFKFEKRLRVLDKDDVVIILKGTGTGHVTVRGNPNPGVLDGRIQSTQRCVKTGPETTSCNIIWAMYSVRTFDPSRNRTYQFSITVTADSNSQITASKSDVGLFPNPAVPLPAPSLNGKILNTDAVRVIEVQIDSKTPTPSPTATWMNTLK